ncbi:VanZ family protein [Facklamia sp. P12932]|uniref:VanZ family protein n=1 Tax=Facklamia sp. P12932 TaxID=3421947 RepID=UPI003D18567C
MYIELVKEIIQRSVSGYFFVIPVLILYFLFLKKKDKKQTKAHIILSFIFCYYLIGILTMTGIGKISGFSPRFEGIRFNGITSISFEEILNVFLFMPLGLFLPILYKNFSNIKKVASTAFFISLSIELYQMFGRGITSLNDLIANVLGSCLGYVIYKVVISLTKNNYEKSFFSVEVNTNLEILFYWVVCFIVMITIQPLVISFLFKLG